MQPPSRNKRKAEDAAPQLGLFGKPAPKGKPAKTTPAEPTLGELFDKRLRARAEEKARDEQAAEATRSNERTPGATRRPPPLAALLPQEDRRPAASVPWRRDSQKGKSLLPAWARDAMKSSAAERLVRAQPEAGADEGLESAEPASETRRVWTVADLVGQVRTHMEATWADLWVHGEISNLRAVPSGHLYFTLKDGDSQLPAVLFRKQAQMLRFRPEDGLEILLRGKVSVYEQRGQMQLIAEHLEPVGAGSLLIAFEQLKARLAAEGLFDSDRKRALPAYPRCVGIITSPSGAVIRDFVNVANRRHAALDILLYPAVVQGSSAASEIAAGLVYFNDARNVDVIVIARGGGSPEDLACFNNEALAHAIAASSLPVVSAIGHETDFTIADFVADLRAPTPSAAAELITAAQHRVGEQVEELAQRLLRGCRYQLMLARQRLAACSVEATHARLSESFNRREQRVDTLRFRLEAALRERLHAASARLVRSSLVASSAGLRQGLGVRTRTTDALRFRMESAQTRTLRMLGERLAHARTALLQQDARQRLLLLRSGVDACNRRLNRAAAGLLAKHRSQHHALTVQLETLSPLAVLSRGYALVFDEAGSLVKQAAAVEPGDLLTLRLADSTVQSRAVAAQTKTGDT